MGAIVVSGASIICTMAAGIGLLQAAPGQLVLAGGKPVVTIKDVSPFVQVGACGMCTSLLNPVVASATAAALGVLTPQPCAPCPAGCWAPGGKPITGDAPCVTTESVLNCAYGGMIRVTAPGQSKVLV